MPAVGGIGTGTGTQLILAAFDDWDRLQPILIEMEAGTGSGPPLVSVLHARSDVPPDLAHLLFLSDTTKLSFTPSRQQIICTKGPLADSLSTRLARGARTLADALHDLLGSIQAEQVERHVNRGHVILCVELRSTDDISVICGRLVRASPHMVEMCTPVARRDRRGQ